MTQVEEAGERRPSSPVRDLARVIARDGRGVVLPEGGWLVVGRDTACALAFPDEPRLSRRAVHLETSDSGVLISNLSSTHGLVVDADGTVSRVPAGSAGAVLTRNHAEITGPTWGASTFSLTVVVDADPVPTPPSGEAITQEPLRLRADTEEFVTALVLCRGRLLDPTTTTPPPPVPDLTRQVLEVSDRGDLVRELDADGRARTRLTGRVQEHLKTVRTEIARSGLAPPGVRLTPAEMVELLVDSGAVTPQHLALLDDPSWRAAQAQWSGE